MTYTIRKFDGKRFEHYIMTHDEEQAKKAKKSNKIKGCLCRVTKSYDASGLWYDVWRRC